MTEWHNDARSDVKIHLEKGMGKTQKSKKKKGNESKKKKKERKKEREWRKKPQ